jgi:hypothetical protein
MKKTKYNVLSRNSFTIAFTVIKSNIDHHSIQRDRRKYTLSSVTDTKKRQMH